MTKAFRIQDLSKSYSNFNLGPLDLDLEPGMTMGLIGANGTGKTTTLNCMMGLVRPDGGSVEIFGRPASMNAVDWKQDVGYVCDDPVFYESWTGSRNLRFISGFYPKWSDERAMSLAQRFNLPLDKKARELSRGNRVKLALVAALSYNPKVYLFDEPTVGLDPVVHSEVLDVLWELLEKERCSILFSTHNMGDVAKLADELVFLDGGRITLRTDKDTLIDKWRRLTFSLEGDHERFAAATLDCREGSDYQLISYDVAATRQQLQSIGAVNVVESRLSLDDIAVQVIKGGGNVAAR